MGGGHRSDRISVRHILQPDLRYRHGPGDNAGGINAHGNALIALQIDKACRQIEVEVVFTAVQIPEVDIAHAQFGHGIDGALRARYQQILLGEGIAQLTSGKSSGTFRKSTVMGSRLVLRSGTVTEAVSLLMVI